MLQSCLEPTGVLPFQMQREGSAVTLLGESLKQTSHHQLQFMYMGMILNCKQEATWLCIVSIVWQ